MRVFFVSIENNSVFFWMAWNLIIIEEYTEIQGEKLMPTKKEAEKFMESMDNVRFDGNRYFTTSEKSKHITKFVVNQNDKFSRMRMQQNRNWNNAHNSSLPSNPRPLISYVWWNHHHEDFGKRNNFFNINFIFPKTNRYNDDFVNVNVPPPTYSARKITNRRRTDGFYLANAPPPVAKYTAFVFQFLVFAFISIFYIWFLIA